MAAAASSTTRHFTTNDGVQLAYEAAGSSGPVVVLIHGWSGSRKYFQLNVPALAASCQVYALDLRHHGDSSAVPPRGYHVSRLAADLRDFLEALSLNDVTVVGTSMGCAVIWSYVELFGTARLKQAVFVDQAPLQNRAPGWTLGSKGCYDEATLQQLQQQLAADLGAIADGNAAGCLSLPLPDSVLAQLRAETLRCRAEALGAIMADHTQLDWRPVLPLLALPCLNVVGGAVGCFRWRAACTRSRRPQTAAAWCSGAPTTGCTWSSRRSSTPCCWTLCSGATQAGRPLPMLTDWCPGNFARPRLPLQLVVF